MLIFMFNFIFMLIFTYIFRSTANFCIYFNLQSLLPLYLDIPASYQSDSTQTSRHAELVSQEATGEITVFSFLLVKTNYLED